MGGALAVTSEKAMSRTEIPYITVSLTTLKA